MKNPKVLVLMLLALAGVFISGYQTYHFFALRGGVAGFKSICTINEAADCQSVEMSRFAEVVPGLPLSAVALAWYLAFFFISFFGRNRFWFREYLRAAWIYSGVGLLVSAIYLAIMLLVVRSLCVFCLGVDLINFLSFVLVWSLKPERFKPPFEKTQWKVFAGITVASLVVTLVFAAGMNQGSYSRQELEDFKSEVFGSPPVSIAVDSTSPSIGPVDAPITIIKFSDFQCPACKRGALAIHPVLSRYKGRIHFVFKNFPLDVGCNRAVKTAVHEVACAAALAGLCAHQQGKFFQVYEAYFEHQSELSPVKLLDLAEGVGVNRAKLEACIASPEARALLERDITQGIEAKVGSTPTFFLNGYMVQGYLTPKLWMELIDSLPNHP